MDLLIIVALGVAVIAYFIWKERKLEESSPHPLDGPTKTPDSGPEPWPFPTGRPPEGDTKPADQPLPVMPTLTAVLDNNKDGKVDVKDVVSVLDVNKDGKVDLKDAIAAADVVVKKTKTVAKKAKANAAEAVEKVKKTRKTKK